MTEAITIKHSTADDTAAIRELGELDGRRAPAGPALLGLVDGRLVAAVGIEDRRTVADPFSYTANIVKMLSVRAAQQRPQNGGGLLRWFLLGHRLGREGMVA
jgi:hypothetical protein